MKGKLLGECVAAIIVASASAASAQVTVILDEPCTQLTITTSGNMAAGTASGDGCPGGLAGGIFGKFKGIGKKTPHEKAVPGVGMALFFDHDPATYYLILATPFQTGQPWTRYRTVNGTKITSKKGTYTVNPVPGPSRHGRRSIRELVK